MEIKSRRILVDATELLEEGKGVNHLAESNTSITTGEGEKTHLMALDV